MARGQNNLIKNNRYKRIIKLYSNKDQPSIKEKTNSQFDCSFAGRKCAVTLCEGIIGGEVDEIGISTLIGSRSLAYSGPALSITLVIRPETPFTQQNG